MKFALTTAVSSILDGSLPCRFYTECLGMKLLRKRDIPEERYTNAFLGYGPEDSHFVVELTYSKGQNAHVMSSLHLSDKPCLSYLLI
jgi:lactoylglutathione lyase